MGEMNSNRAQPEMEESSRFIEVELETLQSIYLDEIKVETDDQGQIHVWLDLHPATADNIDKQFVKLTLKFSLSPTYPEEAPKLYISNPRGLSDEKLNSILQDLESLAKSKKGNSMLFEIIERAKEHLTTENRPCGECAVCLHGFSECDVFTKTACYHHFHSHCLAQYADSAGSELLCPVCRVPIKFEGSAGDFPPPTAGEVELVELGSEILEMQEEMARLFRKQVEKGGIIDLEAEKRRFLLEISCDPPSSPKGDDGEKAQGGHPPSTSKQDDLESNPERNLKPEAAVENSSEDKSNSNTNSESQRGKSRYPQKSKPRGGYNNNNSYNNVYQQNNRGYGKPNYQRNSNSYYGDQRWDRNPRGNFRQNRGYPHMNRQESDKFRGYDEKRHIREEVSENNKDARDRYSSNRNELSENTAKPSTSFGEGTAVNRKQSHRGRQGGYNRDNRGGFKHYYTETNVDGCEKDDVNGYQDRNGSSQRRFHDDRKYRGHSNRYQGYQRGDYRKSGSFQRDGPSEKTDARNIDNNASGRKHIESQLPNLGRGSSDVFASSLKDEGYAREKYHEYGERNRRRNFEKTEYDANEAPPGRGEPGLGDKNRARPQNPERDYSKRNYAKLTHIDTPNADLSSKRCSDAPRSKDQSSADSNSKSVLPSTPGAADPSRGEKGSCNGKGLPAPPGFHNPLKRVVYGLSAAPPGFPRAS